MPVLRVRCAGRCEELSFRGQPVLGDLLTEHGFPVAHPCGGRGVCGKCAVSLSGDVSPENEAERRAGTRLSCQTVLQGDCEVELPLPPSMEQIEYGKKSIARASGRGALGAAIDVGTTTLALRLYELSTGAPLGAATAINPQTAVAADVMGRIDAALHGKAALLQVQVQEALAELLEQACTDAACKAERVKRLVITGNTTMLYLLTGRSPRSLAGAPFAADCLFDVTETILGRPALLPACMNAFVGADITCALLASGLCGREETAMLCDIGTNGELALWREGTLYVTSTAAGPAFEGAGIISGCGSVRGAIDRVWTAGGQLLAHTIGDEAAVGICGSGLIDAAAALLQLGYVDETGAMTLPVVLRDGIAVYPQDIRNVQLAKAAIAAGMQMLMKNAGVDADEIKRLDIAGGFGSHLDMASAAAVGLIPSALMPIAAAIGNAALDGAAQLLLEPAQRQYAARLAAGAKHVRLGGDPDFSDRYIDNMLFFRESLIKSSARGRDEFAVDAKCNHRRFTGGKSR